MSVLINGLPQISSVIKEADEGLGGNYQGRAIILNAGATIGLHTLDVSWPIDVGILSSEFYVNTANIGDCIEVLVAPDTTIGAIGANVAVNDTVITVSSTVLDNINVGYWVKLTDGTNTDDLGRCLSIDTDNSQITVETASPTAYTAATPTYVQMTIKMVYDYKFGEVGRFTLGESKIGSSLLPANTVMRFVYDNKTAAAKKFSTQIEYLY